MRIREEGEREAGGSDEKGEGEEEGHLCWTLLKVRGLPERTK